VINPKRDLALIGNMLVENYLNYRKLAKNCPETKCENYI
jgi:hypothetical protein